MAKGAQAIMTMRRGIMGSRGKTPPSPAEGKSKGQPVSISFSETPTSQPLTKGVPEDMAKGAVKMLINVMKYMGDYPTKKELDPFELMQKICQTALDKPKLRDELFCQLIKQTTNNPRSGSTLRGWELLSICCGLFVPSRTLGPYLLDHLVQAKSDTGKVAQDTQRLAQVAVLRLDRLRAVGLRSHAPSSVEYAAIRRAENIPCTVWTLDGVNHPLEMDMAATVRDITVRIMSELELSKDAIQARTWRLCSLRGTAESVKHRTIGVESSEPLEDKQHICDLLAIWEKETKASGTTQLIFRESLSLNLTSPLNDSMAIHLLAHQAIAHVVSGMHPVSEGEAAYLAALQYYFDKLKGTVEGEISGRALSAALLFLPINLKYRKSDEEWISAITNEWNHLELNMGTVEAERKYLETVQRWPYYGGNVFHVESKQFPQANAIVISKDGLGIFCLPEKEPLASAAFKAIFNWSSPNRDTVGVVVGSLMNPQRYVFTTSQANQVVQTFASYVGRLVAKNKEMKSEAVAGQIRRPF